ncbi:MAG: hypothetical protein PHT53_00105 [Candidatus Omnitrophica bacterium]|nr:hypothetical protein [Candidatus Omnitrophota bacterium]
MNYKIKKSITKESVLFLVFLIGILLITLAQHYKAIAVTSQSSKGFLAGKLFVAIPDGSNLQSKDAGRSYAAKSLLLHKLGLLLLFLYLLYLVIRFIPWVNRKIKVKYPTINPIKGGLIMSNWIKQNWFKIGVLLALITMSLSVAYYFVLFLPNNQRFSGEVASKSASEIMDFENKCFSAASEFFKENGFDPKNSGFQNHYNNKLNKCFINIKSAKVGEDGRLSFYKALYDVYNRKMYGENSWKPEEGKNYWEVKPTVCSILDKPCQAIEDYENLVKIYMEE